MKFEYPAGATPLDPDEIIGLIPEHITTQAELNEWEQANILEAEMRFGASHRFAYNVLTSGYNVAGSYGNDLNINALLEVAFLQQIHKKMFDKTWRWAGQFRKSNKNIGVDWIYVPIHLRELLEDIKYQIANHSYEINEIAVRLHHRLVAIHPFPNGNGRHARLMTDHFLIANNQPRFSWGESNLYENSTIRKDYIKALQAADKHDYQPLLAFVRQFIQ